MRTIPVLLLAGATCATLGAACSMGSATGTPTPTPLGLSTCQLLWEGSAANPALVNLFLVMAPLAGFDAGIHALGQSSSQGVSASLFYDAEVGSNGNLITYSASSHPTNGSYTVTGAVPSGPFAVTVSAGGPGFQASGSLSRSTGDSGTLSVEFAGSSLTLSGSESACFTGTD